MDEETRLDFRLFEVEFQITTLSEHLHLIEDQARRHEENARGVRDLMLSTLSIDDEDYEFNRTMTHHEYEYQVEIVFPFVYRNPFIVVMYSVYESAVTQVAETMQRQLSKSISIDDLRGNFLLRAMKYFSEVLNFDLIGDNRRWERLHALRYIRNIVAHSNGRLKPGSAKQLSAIKRESFGEWLGFMRSTEEFSKEMFEVVKGELLDLIERYRAWDSKPLVE